MAQRRLLRAPAAGAAESRLVLRLHERLHAQWKDGAFLNLIDEFTRECLAIYVGRRINSNQVIEVLADVMIAHGIPEYIRSDNGPEFVAKELRKWLAKTGAKTLYIEPGSP